jgi:carbamoyl-phosphate synthase large subunit
MKSTGEVMGIGATFGDAYYDAMLATGMKLAVNSTVYVTVRDDDKPLILPVVKKFVNKGLKIVATRGTAQYLRDHGIPVKTVYRISEKFKPDVLSLMRRGEIDLVINTPTETTKSRKDGYMMRRLAIDLQIPFITTVQAAKAVAECLKN